MRGKPAGATSFAARRFWNMDPPPFPEPQFSRAHVCVAEFGYMLVSQASRRRFFCPHNGHCVPTQFGGSVSKCYEMTSVDLASSTQGGEGEEEHALVTFEGNLYRYCPSRPMGLKTCRIDVLKLEAHWQDAELGELSGEVRGGQRGQLIAHNNDFSTNLRRTVLPRSQAFFAEGPSLWV